MSLTLTLKVPELVTETSISEEISFCVASSRQLYDFTFPFATKALKVTFPPSQTVADMGEANILAGCGASRTVIVTFLDVSDKQLLLLIART